MTAPRKKKPLAKAALNDTCDLNTIPAHIKSKIAAGERRLAELNDRKVAFEELLAALSPHDNAYATRHLAPVARRRAKKLNNELLAFVHDLIRECDEESGQ